MEEMARGTSCSATRYVRDLLSQSIVLCILSCTHAQSTTADALDGLADWLQWDVQPTIKRINESLQKRGYLTNVIIQPAQAADKYLLMRKSKASKTINWHAL